MIRHKDFLKGKLIEVWERVWGRRYARRRIIYTRKLVGERKKSIGRVPVTLFRKLMNRGRHWNRRRK